MIPPQTLVIGVWENPIDPFISHFNKIYKDKNRQIQIVDEKFAMFFKVRRKFPTELRYPVKGNLWRIIPGYSDWIEILSQEVNYGAGEFEINGCTFSYALEAVNNKQVRFNVTFQPWHVFAEKAGRLAYGYAAPENLHGSAS